MTVHGAGKTLTYAYDGLGRTTSLSEGSTTRATWAYDTAKDAAGRSLLGLPASATRYVDGAEYRTSVDRYDDSYKPLSSTVTLPAVGDLASLEARSFTTKYEYTADGQVAAVTLPKVTEAGSAGGATVLGQEKVTTYFDSASMPRWMGSGFGWGTYVAESRYTAYGQPLLMDVGNSYGAVVSYQYDDVTNRLTHVALKREQVVGTDLAVSYGYDAAGNVTSVKDKPTNAVLSGPQFEDNQCFGYDGLRRLTSAWTATDAANCGMAQGQVRPEHVGGAAPYWTQYEYDPLGNRTRQVEHATNGTAGATTTTYEYGAGSAGPHALTSTSTVGPDGSESATYAYDAAGNQVSRDLPDAPVQLLGWDAEGELAQVGIPDGGTEGEDSLEDGRARFVYDASGDRLARTDSGGTTVYLPGGQELHVDPTGGVSATRYYSFAGQTVAVRTDRGLGGVTSLVNDHHGTPLAAVPNTVWTATSVTRIYTDPYGGARGESTTESVPGDRQFLGKVRDNVTGLTLLGARYYDEAVGRFISVDPVVDLSDPQQWHGYSYANNNPLTLSDPTGYLPGAAMIDGQFGAGAARVQKASNKKSSSGGAPAAKASSVPTVVGKPERTTVNSIATKYNAGDYAGVIRDWTPAVQRELANDPNVLTAWTLYNDALIHEKICSEQDCAPPCRELSCELEGAVSALSMVAAPLALAKALTALLRIVGRGGGASLATAATAKPGTGPPRDALGRFTSGAGGESAATVAGRSAHLNYSNTLGGGNYVFNRALPGSRLRPDAVDYSQNIVRELKPATPAAVSRGWRQVNEYKAYLEQATGEKWTAYVDVYTP
ncbi:RHS repeat-associated core domain-containing protein [Actinotalea sp. C106]|uniref:RHS repeat-associated core domain-containing protein n=1 Tax=Actinotalea sp. C106 TaxID=2908644 RepID=UPI002027E7A2|nr:RHS repeat-associated core domain-containing protein [Actinotalea sp. C106]